MEPQNSFTNPEIGGKNAGRKINEKKVDDNKPEAAAPCGQNLPLPDEVFVNEAMIVSAVQQGVLRVDEDVQECLKGWIGGIVNDKG